MAVVVHAFSQHARDLHQLEMLWGDAPKVEWQPEEPAEGQAEEKSEDEAAER